MSRRGTFPPMVTAAGSGGPLRGLAIGLALLAAVGSGRAQDAAPCAITGRFVLGHVRLRTVDGVRPRRTRFEDLDVEARLVPSLDGRHELSGALPDGRSFTARLRALPSLEVREPVTVSGAWLGPGVRVLDVHPGPVPTFDLALGDGVQLREVPVPCRAIGPLGSSIEPPRPAPEHVGPLRRPARRRLLLFDAGGAARLRMRVEAGVTVRELEQRSGRVRVVWTGARARVEGWIDAPDLVPAPALDSLARPR
jgi:hypothetical protein